MLSYAEITHVQYVNPGDTGLYQVLGILAIIAGLISFFLIAKLSVSARPRRELNFLRKDPFDDSFKREQAKFFMQVMHPGDGEEPPTIVPGDDNTRPFKAIDSAAIYGVVIEESRQECVPGDDGDSVMSQIRESNAAFLQKWGVGV